MSQPDRIWKTSIAPYDQVFALSQYMINLGIDNLYKRLEVDDIPEGKKPEPASCYADENNYIDNVIFGPPTVTIKADYSNVTSVLFRMHIKSGNVQLRKFLGMDPVKKRPSAQVLTMDIADWYVTVPVDLKFTEIDTNTARGKAVQARSAAKGKPDHSIFELLMDLESMSLSNGKWEMGDWGDEDWLEATLSKSKTRPPGWKMDTPRSFVDFDKDFQTTLEFMLQKISSVLMDANLNSMGFAVMAKDENRRATFEVNDTRYQTYPWTHPETKNAAVSGLDGEGRLNYLLYLETVGKNTPPKASDASAVLSTRLGNWSEGRQPGIDGGSLFGTFKLSSSMFMESYILPKLSAINRIMSLDVESVYAKSDYGWKWSSEFSVTISVGLGNPGLDETTFKLKRQEFSWNDAWQDTARNFLQPLRDSPGEGATVWRYEDIEWGSTNKNTYSHVSACETWVWADTITLARAYTLPGKNEIVYEGRTWTNAQVKINPDIIIPNKYYKLECTCKWKIIFTLSEVSDGGIKIEINHEAPQREYTINDDMDWLKTDLDRRYPTAYSNFEYILNSIRNCLQGQEKFTLPASGVFYFKNPVMDVNSNLVCELEYNGNPKLGGVVNEDASDTERDKVGRGSFASMPAAATVGGSSS